MPAVLVPTQKVQQIPAFAAGLAVQLGVAAVAAADGDELFVLDVKHFGEVPAGGLQSVRFILLAAAFGADVLVFFHNGFLRIVRLGQTWLSQSASGRQSRLGVTFAAARCSVHTSPGVLTRRFSALSRRARRTTSWLRLASG